MHVIVETLLTTLQAIITVFVVYLAGFVMVKLDKIDGTGVRMLSLVANYLFIPALLFTSLASGLTVEVFKETYHLILAGMGLTIYYFFLANFIMLKLAKPTKRFERWFVLGQSVVNFVALPLVLMTSMCSQLNFPKPDFSLTVQEKLLNVTVYFSSDECTEIAELYIFLFSSATSLIAFSVGWQYVLNSEAQTPESVCDSTDVPSTTATELEKQDKPLPAKEVKVLVEEKPSLLRYTWEKFLEIFVYRPLNFFQLLGFFIGLISPIQDVFYGEDGVLRSITEGVAVLGSAGTATINVIMACTLSLKLLSLPSWTYLFGDEEKLGISRQSILFFALGRMVIVPSITMIWYYQLVEYVFPDDKMMKMVALLELFVPTANMSVVMAQIMGQTDNAETLAVSVLLQYIIGVASVTCATFVIIYLLDLA